MKNTLLTKLRQLYYRNPQRKQPKFPYDMQKVVNYARSANKKLSELTEQELSPFLLNKNAMRKA